MEKHEIGLPLIALGLVIVPVLIGFLLGALLSAALPSFVFLFLVLLPIAGMITGIFSLSRGKDRLGLAGKVLAIAAISLPAIFIILPIFVLFIGVATGGISGM
jgi:hypothetical protein